MSDAASVKSDTHPKATTVRGREVSLEELGVSAAVESEAFSAIRHYVRSGECCLSTGTMSLLCAPLVTRRSLRY